MTLSRDDIRRVLLAHHTRPAGDPLAGFAWSLAGDGVEAAGQAG